MFDRVSTIVVIISMIEYNATTISPIKIITFNFPDIEGRAESDGREYGPGPCFGNYFNFFVTHCDNGTQIGLAFMHISQI